jgi:hypothetical protein
MEESVPHAALLPPPKVLRIASHQPQRGMSRQATKPPRRRILPLLSRRYASILRCCLWRLTPRSQPECRNAGNVRVVFGALLEEDSVAKRVAIMAR